MIICVSLNEFIRITTGWIYGLAPYHKPRFIDEIVDEIIKRFKTNCKSIGTDFFYYEVELKDLYKFIENILMPIDKFRDLNLSPREYAQGIEVDDPDRPKFQFVSGFDGIPDDDNFVDLDACIQNIFIHYEHNAYRQWEYGEIDTGRLSEFRKEYFGEPEVKGEWVEGENGNIKCNQCGCEIRYSYLIGNKPDFPKFCCNCGAAMRKGGRE